MPTPKLNRIITEFGRRIGAPPVWGGSYGVVLQDRYDLSSTEYVAYVNKALMKFFQTKWEELGRDKQAFINAFPEMMTTKTLVFSTSGTNKYIYNLTGIASTMRNFFVVLNAYDRDPTALPPVATPAFIEALDTSWYFTIEYGLNTIYTPTTKHPFIIATSDYLHVYPPLGVGGTRNIQVNYIAMPLAADGTFYTQNGTTDSPFDDIWNSQIAEIAEQLFKIESQENA